MSSGLKFLLRAVVSLGLIAVLVSRVSWEELRGITGSLRPEWFPLVFGGMFLVSMSSSYKWSVFLRADGIHVPYPRLLASYLVSTFFSCFLPSSIGGDVYRVYTIGKTHGASRSLASVVMGRITGFFILSLIGLVAAILCRDLIQDSRVVWTIFGVMMAVVVCFIAVSSQRLVAFGCGIADRIGLRKVSKLASGLQSSIAAYRERPAVIFHALGISIVQQGIVVVSIWCVSRAVGLDLSLIYFLAFVPVIEAVTAVPISIFGLGIRDFGFVVLFGTVGLTRVECLSISLVYVTVTLVYSTLGGVIYLLRSGPQLAEAHAEVNADPPTPSDTPVEDRVCP